MCSSPSSTSAEVQRKQKRFIANINNSTSSITHPDTSTTASWTIHTFLCQDWRCKDTHHMLCTKVKVTLSNLAKACLAHLCLASSWRIWYHSQGSMRAVLLSILYTSTFYIRLWNAAHFGFWEASSTCESFKQITSNKLTEPYSYRHV